MGLLPDHLHEVWTLPPDDADFGIRWAMIKRFVSKQCGPELKRDAWMSPSKQKRKESTIWQRHFWQHQIRDESDYQTHMDYIHYATPALPAPAALLHPCTSNPLKHGLVEKVADWPYSTFHRYVRQGVYGIDWAGVINEQKSEGFGEA